MAELAWWRMPFLPSLGRPFRPPGLQRLLAVLLLLVAICFPARADWLRPNGKRALEAQRLTQP